MPSYQLQLRGIRLGMDGTDDVALFDVAHEGSGRTQTVPAILSPLFRLLWVEPHASAERRREVVTRLGAWMIAKRLRQGAELPLEGLLVFTTDDPRVSHDLDRFVFSKEMTIEVDDKE